MKNKKKYSKKKSTHKEDAKDNKNLKEINQK